MRLILISAGNLPQLVNEYPNLLVVQTLSKSRSLAGLRVGWALGSEELIDGLNRVKNSFNSYTLDRLALAGSVVAFEDEAYFREITAKVITTREKVTAELKAIGFKVTDSAANFVFIFTRIMPLSSCSNSRASWACLSVISNNRVLINICVLRLGRMKR